MDNDDMNFLLPELRELPDDTKSNKRMTIETSLLGLFGAQIGVFAILAWIVPFGHITMEFLINAYIIIFLKLKKRMGSMIFLGLIVGLIDAMVGLGGPGGFLAPVVYGFRFGFLEIFAKMFDAKDKSKFLSLINAVGYFLTSSLIWIMYYAIGIPLGNEAVQSMWFIFAFLGSIVSIAATLLACKLSIRLMKYLKKNIID